MTTRELLTALMACSPITADVERVNAAVERLRLYFSDNKVHSEVWELGGRRILYAATKPGHEVDVLLNAHLDVVPAAPGMFLPREKAGWLLGRGTHDCLGNAAILAHLLPRLSGKASVGVIFSTDEETGGETTGFMVERGYRARRLILVVDGSGYSVITAQKGILVLRLRASGKACHAAEPWKGRNAIDALIDGYQRIRNLIPDVVPPDEWHDTVAATVIRGGNVHNKVPESAEMTLNIRLTESTDPDALAGQIRALSGLETIRDMGCLPVFVDERHREIQALIAHMQSTLGHDIAVKRSNGATDARHFTGLGVPIAIIGVPGRDLHGDTEAVELSGLAAYEEMLNSFLQPGVD